MYKSLSKLSSNKALFAFISVPVTIVNLKQDFDWQSSVQALCEYVPITWMHTYTIEACLEVLQESKFIVIDNSIDDSLKDVILTNMLNDSLMFETDRSERARIDVRFEMLNKRIIGSFDISIKLLIANCLAVASDKLINLQRLKQSIINRT